MIIHKYNNQEDWLEGRKGKITGTKLKDLIVKRGTGKKIGFYDLIAERVAIPPSDENPMDRGHRLEPIAIDRFTKETGIEVDKTLQIICREDYPDIAYSPDGVVDELASVEVKCKKSSLHLKAYLTKEIPSEYEEQSIQPFCVNDKLQKLYFVFYDPLMPIDFFFFTINREDIQDKITNYLEQQIITLQEIEEIEKQLTF